MIKLRFLGSLFAALGLSVLGLSSSAQTIPAPLSVHWEELTGPDFIQAIQQAQGVCVLPFGILEKHGAHLPLGTDLINVRYVTEKAAQKNYAILFPAYYFGQIAEAKQEPGTIAYSLHMQVDLLQETTDEMGRNGCSKIIIVNGHGGNEHLLPFFAQQQLQTPHDYVVYIYRWEAPESKDRPYKPGPADYHGGEAETSHTLISAPGLVHLDRAREESGADQARLKLPDGVYTGIWWYASFPNHYSGDASLASKELGEYDTRSEVGAIANVIRAVKADGESLKLQQQFFHDSARPLATKQ